MNDSSLKEIGSSKINSVESVDSDSQIQYLAAFDNGNGSYDLFILYSIIIYVDI